MNKKYIHTKLTHQLRKAECIGNPAIAEKGIKSNLRDYWIYGGIDQDMSEENLLHLSLTTGEKNGVTCELLDSGDYRFTGTPTEKVTFLSNVNYKLFSAGTYYIPDDLPDNVTFGFNFYTAASGGTLVQKSINSSSNRTLKIDKEYYLAQVYLYFNNNAVGTEFNFTFFLQLTEKNTVMHVPYGTSPTPDNPKNYYGVGKIGKNLIGEITTTNCKSVNNATVTIDNQKVTVNNANNQWGCAVFTILPLKKGKTYTFTAKVEKTNSSTGCCLYASPQLFNNNTAKWSSLVGEGGTATLTFMVEKDVKTDTSLGNIRLYPKGADSEQASATFSEISLVEGKAENPYCLPIHTSGKNLININEFQCTNPLGIYYNSIEVVEDNKLIVKAKNENAIARAVYHCKVPVGEKITISTSKMTLGETGNKSNSRVYFKFVDDEDYIPKSTEGTVFWNPYNEENNISKATTITASKPYLMFGVAVQKYGSDLAKSTLTIEDLQIEIGSEASEYEPYNGEIKRLYLSEPLYGIDESRDLLNYNSKNVTKKTFKLDLTSELSWTSGASNSLGRIFSTSLNHLRKYSLSAISNYCTAISSSVMNLPNNLAPMSIVYGGTNSYLYVFVGNEIAETVDEWKEWLDNHEMYVIYALNGELEVHYSDDVIPIVPQNKGTTLYQVPPKGTFKAQYRYRN